MQGVAEDWLVVMALPLEAQDVFEQAGIPVLYTGVGKVNATLMLMRELARYRHAGRALPGVVNFGSAGSRRFATGTLVACTTFEQRDMDVSGLGFPPGVTPFDAVPAVLQFETPFTSLPAATCGTGDSFETGTRAASGDVVDMEAYALAKVCHVEGTAFACAKFVSDGADHAAAADWQANLHRAADRFLELYRGLVAGRLGGAMRAPLILALFFLLATAQPARAQHATGADVFSGEQAFQNVCANCHGKAGNQIANVDLGHGAFRKPYTDDELAGIVMKGIPGTPMPATPNMNREQADQIVAYLRSRAVSTDAAAGGDAGRGKALFAGKGRCLSCHRVHGEGSRLGPDLGRVGLLRTSDHLARSLLEPDIEVQPVNRSYAVSTRDGRRFSGRLLNHDAYSVQLLDDSEQLRSFMKRDLASGGFIASPMPSVRGVFDDQELADVVQYLVSLRGVPKP